MVNRRWLEYLDLPLEESSGWSWTSLIHPEDPEDLEDLVNKWRSSLAAGEPLEVEARSRRGDGEYRRLLHRAVPLRDEHGKIVKWYVSSIDIEDRKRAEERLQQENVALREEIDKASMFEEIVGTSPALQAVLSRVSKVAPSDSTVLITGETGTGKELVARAIHRRSHRASRAFISVNCAAIPRDLIASGVNPVTSRNTKMRLASGCRIRAPYYTAMVRALLYALGEGVSREWSGRQGVTARTATSKFPLTRCSCFLLRSVQTK